MSYEVKVRHVTESGDGISVEALVDGTPVAHTFPKGLGFFDEPDWRNHPRFIDKVVEKYEEHKKRQLGNQRLTEEEKKVDNAKFENKVYRGESENFKEEEKQVDNMTEVDLDNPDKIRTYLKENMAEGYLSEDEGLNIDKFVDEYKRLLDVEENLEEIVKEVVGVESE